MQMDNSDFYKHGWINFFQFCWKNCRGYGNLTRIVILKNKYLYGYLTLYICILLLKNPKIFLQKIVLIIKNEPLGKFDPTVQPFLIWRTAPEIGIMFSKNRIIHAGHFNFWLSQINFSLRHGYLYIPTFAAGNTAIQIFLQNYEVDSKLKNSIIDSKLQSGGAHSFREVHNSTIGLHNIPLTLWDKIINGQTSIANFSVIRNPFIKIYKHYINYYINRANGDFNINNLINDIKIMVREEQDIHLPLQSKQILYGQVHYDFLVRYENYANDLKLLFPIFPNDEAVRPQNEWQNYEIFHNQQLVSAIIELYQDDFMNFGYSLNPFDHDKYDNSVIPRNNAPFIKPRIHDELVIFRGPNNTENGDVYVDSRLNFDTLRDVYWKNRIFK